jgi:hypothetical protein
MFNSKSMKKWIIAYNGHTCEPELISAAVQQDLPSLIFSLKEVKFYVNFKNRSDYMASREGTEADVNVIAGNKSNFKGSAICVVVEPIN